MTESPGPSAHGGPEPEPAGNARRAPGIPGAHSASGTGDDPADLLGRLGDSWTWILTSALATLVPGIIVLVWPHETLNVLAVVVGLYLLAAGALRFVAAFSRAGHGERLAPLLVSALSVLAGVLCLRHPLQTVAALSVIVGAVWLVSGMLTAYTALAFRELPRRGFVLGAAALGVVAGIVVLALPARSALVLTRLLGLWLVLLGLAETGLALARRSTLRAGRPGRPHGTPSAAR
ncbi:HdeD family acid-resistance protein [Streptomyces sp. NPDC046985]|uniref:HdeD family acid-resistance protein n=1 Tax=Streptomyces sp. NPDC046985 TaxID=3155377 RepID=UPI0033C2AED5